MEGKGIMERTGIAEKEGGMGPRRVAEDIYLVGDADLTDQKDCAIYLIDAGGELVMVDSGAGTSVDRIVANIRRLGLDPAALSTLILTHCHIDHVGGAAELRNRFGARLVMHALDAEAVKTGDRKRTGADWYRIAFASLSIDLELEGEEERLSLGDQEIVCLHTPGHTPGSISAYLDRHGQRVLFGQDVHGPFLPEFGADLRLWRRSMKKLLALNADILCEGHFGVYQPNSRVSGYIERYLEEYEE
jgi:glyoxylase-like metal-dependent hydrolase (beta-lactamase superfamily II)